MQASTSTAVSALLPPFANVQAEIKYQSAFNAASSDWRPEDRVEAYLLTASGQVFVVKYGEKENYILPGGIVASARTAKEAVQTFLNLELGFQLAQTNFVFLGRYSVDGSRVYVFGAIMQDYSFTNVHRGVYATLDLLPIDGPLALIPVHQKLILKFREQSDGVIAHWKREGYR